MTALNTIEPVAELMMNQPCSSSSQRKTEKRSNPYAGMSITRLGSEDNEDMDHTHICKRVANEFAVTRNLLVSQSPPLSSDNESMNLFANFLKDMPLPEDYSEKFDGRLIINTVSFDELNLFLDVAPVSQAENSQSEFWKAMYIMQQESH